MEDNNQSAADQGSLSAEALKLVQQEIAEALKSQMKPFHEAIINEFKKMSTEAQNKSNENKDKKSDTKGADDELKKQLESLQKMLEEQTQKAQKAEEAQKLEKLLNVAREHLSTQKIPGEAIPLAIASLHDQKRLFVYDDNGNPGFKGKDKYGMDAVLPMEEGIKSWLSTPEGKLLLPPLETKGTGHKKASTSMNGQSSGQVDWDNPRIVNPYALM